MATKGLLLLLLVTSSLLFVCFGAAVVPGDKSNDDHQLDEGPINIGDEESSVWNILAATRPTHYRDDSDDDDDDYGYHMPFNKSVFPANFIFGSGGSAYQYEGAANRSYKGPSIWDVFTAKYPERIADNSSGMIADDTYHRFKDDVRIMKNLGFDSYRFSISWSRILPRGRISGGLDGRGIAYYNYLIDELLRNNIQPFATLFHFDLPQALQDDNGFLNETIVNDFTEYADLCFAIYGDRVKNWVTINEPWSYSTMGYAYGTFPPNRCSSHGASREEERRTGFFIGKYSRYMDSDTCFGGNSSTEPYIVSQNLILAHASAVRLYWSKYQEDQKGQIGISLCTEWAEPYNASSPDDIFATGRSMAFVYGWFLQPLYNGTYPQQMVTNVGNRLPTFNEAQQEMVKGSFDFIGLNYYTAHFARNIPCSNSTNASYITDPCVNTSNVNVYNQPIGEKTESSWIYIVPKGIRATLNFTKISYNNPPMIVTENGLERRNEDYDRRDDKQRIKYHRQHLKNILNATVEDKVNVSGYIIWSLLDNFEWIDGYTMRFGTVYVDYNHETLRRACKDSAFWFQKFLLSKHRGNAWMMSKEQIKNSVCFMLSTKSPMCACCYVL